MVRGLSLFLVSHVAPSVMANSSLIGNCFCTNPNHKKRKHKREGQVVVFIFKISDWITLPYSFPLNDQLQESFKSQKSISKTKCNMYFSRALINRIYKTYKWLSIVATACPGLCCGMELKVKISSGYAANGTAGNKYRKGSDLRNGTRENKYKEVTSLCKFKKMEVMGPCKLHGTVWLISTLKLCKAV